VFHETLFIDDGLSQYSLSSGQLCLPLFYQPQSNYSIYLLTSLFSSVSWLSTFVGKIVAIPTLVFKVSHSAIKVYKSILIL